MIERNVGDIITHAGCYKGLRLWRIVEVGSRMLEVEVVKHEMPRVLVGQRMRKFNSNCYILVTPSNPHLTTVLASNYMDDDSLTEEDKEIIKEYLYDKAA